MGTLDGMSAVIAGGPAAGALMPLGCVLCHDIYAWRSGVFESIKILDGFICSRLLSHCCP